MTIKTYPLPGKKTLSIGDKTETEFANTLADYGAQYDHSETLREYVTAKHSPWTFDYSWSDEAKALRELAVQSPDSVNNDFIYKHFRTLRILNRGITDIDKKLLLFENLVELTLSANNLKHVHSQYLPRSLRVLELCANEISDLFSLCLEAPALVHLGLGYNRLTYIDDFLSGEHWPQLLSLDLGYNNLTDLVEAIRKLQTLPKLNNLILKGNPLALSPAYRGYVIDKLKAVTILDDVIIEAQERHEFRGMHKVPDNVLNLATVTLEAMSIKNIPMPHELRNPEDQPEYPVITRNYFVEFHYLADAFANDANFQDTGDDADLGNADSETIASSQGELALHSRSGDRSTVPTPHSSLSKPEDGISEMASPRQRQARKAAKGVIRTAKGTWSESIDLGWQESVTRDDLLALRDFLQSSMVVDVIEETILSYPKDDPDKATDDAHPKAAHSAGKDKKKKDEPKEVKKDDKKGKKKKDNDLDMRHEPPEYSLLASFSVSLTRFLEGDVTCAETLTKEAVPSRAPSALAHAQAAAAATAAAADASKKERKKGGGGADDAKKSKDKDAGAAAAAKADKTKSAKAKDAKEPKRGKDDPAAALGAHEDDGDGAVAAAPPLPPLELAIRVSLQRWSTAAEAAVHASKAAGPS